MGNCVGKKEDATNFRKKSKRKHTPIADTIIHKSNIHSSIITMNIKDFYKFHGMIGRGNFGTVYQASKIVNPAKLYAIKSIPKKIFEKKDKVKYLIGELEALQTLDHPNIIRLYQSFEDNHNLHLVTEFCSGGKLSDLISAHFRLPEDQAAKIILKILRVISYLHEKGICHRDIKPENFLFENTTRKSEIKLIDFGLAKIFNSIGRINSVVGTPQFVAPEVLQGSYGPKCDLWSVGVIIYHMLLGKMPVESRTPEEALVFLQHHDIKMSGNEWDSLSKAAKDLIPGLLRKDPEMRLDVRSAIQHI